jgi:hypothetical protein
MIMKIKPTQLILTFASATHDQRNERRKEGRLSTKPPMQSHRIGGRKEGKAMEQISYHDLFQAQCGSCVSLVPQSMGLTISSCQG